MDKKRIGVLNASILISLELSQFFEIIENMMKSVFYSFNLRQS